MSETSSDREIFGAKWAGFFGAALLVGLGTITAVAVYDGKRLPALEATISNTAVGDSEFFPLPQEEPGHKPPAAAVQFKGQPLFPVSFKKSEERDSRMERVGKEESGRYWVYSIRGPVKNSKEESAKAAFYFLKVGPGEYLKLSATPAGK